MTDESLVLPPDLRAAFEGAGAMRPHLEALDWSSTAVGPPSRWPPTLRWAVGVCLGARYPIAIYWGEELTLVYNEAWSSVPGNKHPSALGRPAQEVWPDIWSIVGPEFSAALAGRASLAEDRLLAMRRSGRLEETYFDYNLSPILDDDGRVGGVFNAGVETTARVVGERRIRLLRDLSARLSRLAAVGEVCEAATATIAANPEVIPFALLYEVDGEGRSARLSAFAGVADGTPAAPAVVELGGAGDRWRLADAAGAEATVVVGDLPGRVGLVPAGSWPDPVREAVVLPLAKGGGDQPALAVGVFGVHPGRPLDEGYVAFLEDAAARIAGALVDARLGEEARRVFEAEHRIATTLQQVLLPERLPRIDGIELAARYLPSSVGFEVGGDWYDAVCVPTGEVAVVIGDVEGKGVPAAAAMGQLRNALRAYLLEGFPPEVALERLHRFALSVGTGAFATVLCALLDPESGRLRWCRAGHIPPVVVRADGTTEVLEAHGSPPVGAYPEVSFTGAVAELGPGDALVACTDGMVERRQLDLAVGIDRLAAAAAAGPDDLEALLDHLVAGVDTDRQPDDVAVLIVRRRWS